MKKILLQIKLRFLWAFMALSFSLIMFPVFGQNLVANGSFENSSPLAWDVNPSLAFSTLSVSNTLADWVYTGIIDVHDQTHYTMGCPAGEGVQHIDLNQNGTVTQNITGLAVGASYTFSFYTSIHRRLGTECGTNVFADAEVEIINTSGGTSALFDAINQTSTNIGTWTLRSYTFTAAEANITLVFRSLGSCHSYGGVLIDGVTLESVCDFSCQDADWYQVGTTLAPMSNTVNAYRIGNAGIGTNNPIWNFKLTVDNRHDIFEQNNNRNAIHATAMHTECSFGYGILVNTNPLAGTKALAVQGNSVDRAIIYGNGKSWFGNVMTLGGNPPADACQDLPSTHILTINGTGLINGMNITSDMRFKESIEPIENTDEVIKKLNPVTYQYKTDEFADRNFPEGSTYGFIAQELKEVLPYTVTKEKDGYYSVNYIALIPVLTKAIKDQQTEIEALKAKVEAIAEVNKIQGSLEGGTPTQKVEINKTAMLMQNSPNPLNDVTFIDYYLPTTTTSAFIRVIDNQGRLIQAFPINKTGYGQLELNCTNMVSGTYHYSLIINNNVIDTKTMLIAKN